MGGETIVDSTDGVGPDKLIAMLHGGNTNLQLDEPVVKGSRGRQCTISEL